MIHQIIGQTSNSAPVRALWRGSANASMIGHSIGWNSRLAHAMEALAGETRARLRAARRRTDNLTPISG